jgi:hypothetical protein
MTVSKELAEALRLGGSDAVTLFIEGCLAVRREGGADAVVAWIELALPLLPEAEKSEVVAVLVEALANDGEIEFEGYPSSALH